MPSAKEVAKDWIARGKRELSGEARVKYPDLWTDTYVLGDKLHTKEGVKELTMENLSRENKFYGHYLPSHFKKTRIIDTHGKV